MSVNIADPRTLLQVVEDRTDPKTWLADTFFPDGEKMQTEYIDLDKIDTGTRNEPVYVSPIQDGVVVARPGYARSTFRAPYLKYKRPTTYADLTKALPGEGVYNGKSPAERLAYLRGQDIGTLANIFVRAREIQAARVLTTGKLTIYRSIDGVAAPVEVEQVDWIPTATRTANFPTQTGTSLWDNASVDILEQLATYSRNMANGCGIRPDILIVGSSLVKYLFNDTKVKAYLDNRRYELGGFNPAVYDNKVTYLGRLSYADLQVEIFTYSEIYVDTSSAHQPMIPLKKFVLTSRSMGSKMVYGAIQNLKALQMNGGQPYVGRYFTHTWEEGDGSAEYLQMESSPCACLPQPGAIVCTNGLA
jgi:hypothetical protein